MVDLQATTHVICAWGKNLMILLFNNIGELSVHFEEKCLIGENDE